MLLIFPRNNSQINGNSLLHYHQLLFVSFLASFVKKILQVHSSGTNYILVVVYSVLIFMLYDVSYLLVEEANSLQEKLLKS